MATPETIGVTTCGGCKRDADVKKNAGGFAYYHCGCGWSARAHNASSSARFLRDHVRPVNFGDPPVETPAKDPAPEPEIPGNSKTEPTPPKKSGGFRFY